MKKLLLGMATTDLSKEAIDMVRDFLQAWPKLKLTVLHVIPDIQPDSVYPYYSMLPREVARENALAGEIETAAKTVYFADFTDRVDFLCVIGNPVHSICNVAKDEASDLIILDNTDRGVVDRLLLGSVSYGVVHHATIPVVLVEH